MCYFVYRVTAKKDWFVMLWTKSRASRMLSQSSLTVRYVHPRSVFIVLTNPVYCLLCAIPLREFHTYWSWAVPQDRGTVVIHPILWMRKGTPLLTFCFIESWTVKEQGSYYVWRYYEQAKSWFIVCCLWVGISDKYFAYSFVYVS